MAQAVKTHQSCPSCQHKDCLSVYDDGSTFCHSCNKTTREYLVLRTAETVQKERPFSSMSRIARGFPERGFSAETVKRYSVDVGGPEAPYQAKYPLFNVAGDHVGNKVRNPDKQFLFEGNVKEVGLFGRHAFPPGSARYVTVVEGQDDALAAYQMMGSKYPVVSVHSASTAARDVKRDFEYLNSFDNVVFAFDADEPGKKAAREAAAVGLPLHKIKILSMRKHKDANDYLLSRDAEAFTKEWWQAPAYRPDELRFGTELFDDVMERKDIFTVDTPWEGLNKKRAQLRLSEFIVVTADPGVGKTSFLKAIEHKLLTDPAVIEKEYGVGFLHLEESNGDTALGLLSIHNSQPYHLLPRDSWQEDELRSGFDSVLNNTRVVLWDHFGSNSVDAVLNKVRHMAALGCKYIVLDHLSIIVSDQSGDERKQLDEISTKLKTLCMELDICLIAVIHTNRAGQIRGTAGVEQLANIVVRLRRDKDEENEWRRNITSVSIEKNRFSGMSGPACHLWYNAETARLYELDEESSKIFRNGGSVNDTQKPF